MKKILYILLFLCCSKGIALAKDYGVEGKTFEVKEVHILEYIKRKLNSMQENGTLKQFNERLKEKTLGYVKELKGINLKRAEEYRTWNYDPTITLKENLQDQEGRVFAFKGAKVNPLDTVPLTKTLIFIDGTDKDQIEFALSQKDNIKIILTGGDVIDLMKKYGFPLYFDQNAILIQKFGIKSLPAIVRGNGKTLKVEEIVI